MARSGCSFKTEKVSLNSKVNSKPEILLIVDTGMAKIVKGPPGKKDNKGRKIGDPHHGHTHD